MSEDEVMELAQRAGTFTEVEDGQKWLVMSESAFPVFAKLIEDHLRWDGIHTCHDECQRPACVAGRKRVALAVEPLQQRIKDLYRQLEEAEKRLDEQYKLGMEAKLDECILILERLHERSGGQYNYYAHAAKVLKGEI